jgi:hypothetical protein
MEANDVERLEAIARDLLGLEVMARDLLGRLAVAEQVAEQLRYQLAVCRIRCERAEKQLVQEQRRRDRERRDAGA